jgi:thiamine-phosphate pyrophosphorylase
MDQVERALGEAISYLAIGPIFATATKETGYEAVGLELVRRVADHVRSAVPIVAIGGITLERAPAVIAAGASAVAVIGDLLRGDPEERVRTWLRELG